VPSLRRISVPFLDSKICDLSLFDNLFQNQLIEIRTRIDFVNEYIEMTRFYFEKTFDSSISAENHMIIAADLSKCYRDLIDPSRDIVNLITTLFGKRQKS